jgi:hypothetical protein
LEAKVFRVHSCFSYIFLVDGNAIFWKSCRVRVSLEKEWATWPP